MAAGVLRPVMLPAEKIADGRRWGREVPRMGVMGQTGPGQDQRTVQRRMAGGGHQQVAGDATLPGSPDGGQCHALDMLPAVGAGRHPALLKRNAPLAQAFDQTRIMAVPADIGHADDIDPMIMQIEGRLEPRIMPHAEDRRCPRQKPVVPDQTMGAPRLHDPRTLVVIEQQRSLAANRWPQSCCGPGFQDSADQSCLHPFQPERR